MGNETNVCAATYRYLACGFGSDYAPEAEPASDDPAPVVQHFTPQAALAPQSAVDACLKYPVGLAAFDLGEKYDANNGCVQVAEALKKMIESGQRDQVNAQLQAFDAKDLPPIINALRNHFGLLLMLQFVRALDENNTRKVEDLLKTQGTRVI